MDCQTAQGKLKPGLLLEPTPIGLRGRHFAQAHREQSHAHLTLFIKRSAAQPSRAWSSALINGMPKSFKVVVGTAN